MISRRLLSRFVAHKLISGSSRKEVLSQLAAYIVVHRQQKQVSMIVNDIEAELATNGHTLVRVSSATPLNDELRSHISDFVAASSKNSSITVEEDIDSSLLGGVIIKTPDKMLDLSVATKLKRLKTT